MFPIAIAIGSTLAQEMFYMLFSPRAGCRLLVDVFKLNGKLLLNEFRYFINVICFVSKSLSDFYFYCMPLLVGKGNVLEIQLESQ